MAPTIISRQLLLTLSVASVMIITCALNDFAQEPLEEKEAPPTKVQLESWIHELANRSGRPFEANHVLRPPKKVDREGLDIVKRAYSNLAAHFELALPLLVEASDDLSYAYFVEEANGAYVSRSVGSACSDLIRDHIEVHKRFTTVLDFSDIPRSISFIGECGGPAKWYASRRDKSLFELQLETVEWALKQPKPNRGISDKDWEQGNDNLKSFYKKFAEEKKPMSVNSKLRMGLGK